MKVRCSSAPFLAIDPHLHPLSPEITHQQRWVIKNIQSLGLKATFSLLGMLDSEASIDNTDAFIFLGWGGVGVRGNSL
jgi:hypothetical protein